MHWARNLMSCAQFFHLNRPKDFKQVNAVVDRVIIPCRSYEWVTKFRLPELRLLCRCDLASDEQLAGYLASMTDID